MSGKARAQARRQGSAGSEVADDEKAFIESRDMFYLATVDSRGFPSCSYKGGDLVVRVRVEELFINCPRYVHRYDKVNRSQYVPCADCETPFAVWKRIDAIQPALASRDQGKAESAGGLITMEEYFARVGRGEG